MKKLFYNGNFITVDKKLPRAEAVLVEDGTIQAVGTLAQLEEAAGDAERGHEEGERHVAHAVVPAADHGRVAERCVELEG